MSGMRYVEPAPRPHFSKESAVNSIEVDFDRDEDVKAPAGASRVFATIASVLISIILFATLISGQSWFILRNSVSNHSIKTMVRAAFDEMIFAEFPVPAFIDSDTVSIPGVESGNDIILHEVIFDTIDEYYTETFGVEKDHVKELLEHEVLREFLGDIIDNGIDYIMGGEDGEIVSSNRIRNLIEQNSGEIEKITSYSLVGTDYEDIERVLHESGIDNLTWGSAFGTSNEIDTVRGVFALFDRYSAISLIVIIVTTVVLTVLLVIINRRRASNVLLYFGIPCAVSGGIVAVSGLVVYEIFRIITNNFNFPISLNNVFSGVGNTMVFTGLVILGGGIASIIVRVMIGAMRKKG